MAIVVYKCDTCKREIEVSQNQRSVDVINRCTITKGCRGRLYKVAYHPDYIRQSLPDPVEGLNDWVQRKVLYTHTQTIERANWVITHNLGTNPAITVFVDKVDANNTPYQEEIVPTDTIIIDRNTTRLQFDRPWSGVVQFVARSTDTTTILPQLQTTQQEETSVLLTNSSELTIATRSSVFSADRISLNLVYSTASGGTLTSTHTFDSSPSVNSPWVDFNNVVIGGKNYTVRSANIYIAEMVEGILPNGATFYFGLTNLDVDGDEPVVYQPIAKDVLVLLAGEQGTTADKNRTEYLDITSSTSVVNPFSLSYSDSELHSDPSIIETIYPPIQPSR